jgi:aminoglycoside phosphotransferase
MSPKPLAAGFACKFDAGQFLLTLDREGMPERMFQVRLSYMAATTAQATTAGFSMHVEQAQNLAVVAQEIGSRLVWMVPRLPTAEVLLELEDTAERWLMSNFLPALEPIRPSRKIDHSHARESNAAHDWPRIRMPAAASG